MAARRTLRRHQRRLDPGRVRMATSGPGADPRTWVSLARVDDDPEAVRWDTTLGWLVDVTFMGGGLDGEGPVVCRVAQSLVEDGGGEIAPIDRASLVVVLLPGGDPNEEPTIVGQLYTMGRVPPSDVDRDFARQHIVLRTTRGVSWKAGGDIDLTADGTVHLSDAAAAQAFVRGDDQKDALTTFLTALSTWAEAVRAGIVAGGGTLDNTVFDAAIDQAKSGLASALSTKIKGT